MKEEGFLNRALSEVITKKVEARWLTNQTSYNKPASELATPVQIASIAFSVAAITKASDSSNGPDSALVQMALDAKTIGDINIVIDKVNQLYKEEI
jgi:hypothetical protein